MIKNRYVREDLINLIFTWEGGRRGGPSFLASSIHGSFSIFPSPFLTFLSQPVFLLLFFFLINPSFLLAPSFAVVFVVIDYHWVVVVVFFNLRNGVIEQTLYSEMNKEIYMTEFLSPL